MHKNFFIFLYLATNLLIFQSNVYSQNKDQHWEYDKIFLGNEIKKIDGYFYPKTKSHPNDRKLFFMDSGNSEEIMKEKNVKFISENSKYIISNESSRYDSHQKTSPEYGFYDLPIDNDYKNPTYYCYRDKINNKIFCYCQNFSRKTLFHPNPEVSKDIENYGEIFKFEYIRESYDNVQYCDTYISINYTCYFVKDLDGNYVKDKYPKDSENSDKEYILIACEEQEHSRMGSFVNNTDKNCPISKTKNEDGNYYHDCTIN
jgi:hypothetical protein